MTPQHRLAVEIMSECGMSPHEIFFAEGWDVRPALQDIEAVTDVSLRRNDRSHYLFFEGQRRTISEWALVTGISRKTINGRLDRGWSVARTLTEIPTLSRKTNRRAA